MTPYTSDVVVLSWNASATADRKASEIAAFMGASTTAVALTKWALVNNTSIQPLVPRCACLIVDAETLAQAIDAMPAGADELSDLTNSADHIFVYGFEPKERHCAVLRALSSNGLLGVQRIAGADVKFHVAKDHRALCAQFSGLDAGAADRGRDSSFIEGESNDNQSVLIRVADQPFFVRVGYGRSDVFLAACAEIANLDEKVVPGVSLLTWFSRLLPMMIVLRAALKDRAWHSEYSQACFIIDDPLLRRKYGFLEYKKLVETMRPQKFSASIAFIPWNYRRSSKKTAEMFSNNPFSLSLCVHGCDHTRAEFASADSGTLRGKARLALDRMRAHQNTYGLHFDDVMVFPQGLFSSEALGALESCGYLAAVNTTAFPSNVQKALTLRDLLDVAVTAFPGVPLFLRHYPRDPAEFAFDLFLGKPAFLVEHHGYFRNGYDNLRTFAKQLNGLDSELEWRALGTVCSRASLQRTMPSGDIEVRSYTGRFSLVNNTSRTHNYRLARPPASASRPARVTVNGHPWKEQPKTDGVEISLTLEAGDRADIKILPEEIGTAAEPAWKPTSGHNARVLIRRVLSEVRDERVATNKFFDGLLSSAHRLRARGAAKA
jgi:hypothetical protein